MSLFDQPSIRVVMLHAALVIVRSRESSAADTLTYGLSTSFEVAVLLLSNRFVIMSNFASILARSNFKVCTDMFSF